MQISEKDTARFWSYVDKRDGPHGCWVWVGPRDRHRPVFHVHGKSPAAHTIAYLLQHGPPPDGLNPVHSQGCDDIFCIRHVTLSPRKHTQVRLNSQAYLCPSIVTALRQEYATGTYTFCSLARKYGLRSASHAWQIVRRKMWARVP